ncbi:MAG: hypothetical protein ABIR24_10160 [Verrucomicrobiota bacterium]
MKLSKQKQYNLVKLGFATAAVLLLIWFFLVRPGQSRLIQRVKAGNELTQKVAAKKQLIQRASNVDAQLAKNSQKLLAIEEQMVKGDIYLWIEKTLRDFEIPGQIEFSKYDPPQIIESQVPPKLPYKTASFVVTGAATFHDLGTFLANFENSYRHIRIHRLEMEPAALGTGTDEKLSFLLEMQVLVKAGNTASGAKPKSRS